MGWGIHMVRTSTGAVLNVEIQDVAGRCGSLVNNLTVQIKTTMRYHYTPVRMAAIQKSYKQ